MVAAGPGRDAYLSYNNQDLSSYLSNAPLTQASGTGETTAYGDTWREFITTLKEGGLDLTGNWDSTLDGYLGPELGDENTFAYGPAGSTAGYVKYSGSCILTSYDITPTLDGRLEFSGHLTVTGAVDRGTF